MERVIFLFFRRMRAPLLMLMLSYAVSITGLVLIPGVDNEGNTWHYDFFHAFYFVSFMGPTIGFGEIPYELTPGQRMWVTVSLYFTVLSWLYAVGKIFALLQDPAFSRAMKEAGFIRAVRGIRDPYYVICGYGETGSLLVRTLVNRHIQCVVIDNDPEHLADLELDNLPLDVPSFCGDASDTQHLKEAGLRLPRCRGIIAVTDNDDVNVKIAVTSKLLRPELMVVCRAETREAANNMESFDTDHIINPFESFAEHMGMAVRTPSVHMLHMCLVMRAGRDLGATLEPPKGRWVVCGYGRFGQAMTRYLKAEGVEATAIESNEVLVDELECSLPERLIVGSGTDPEPLHEAGVESAAGVVAGTENDANNLSIVMTAREMNPRIFQVARQNKRADSEIFEAANLDLVMEPSRVIVWRILPLITVPLLSDFLAHARRQDEVWAAELVKAISGMTDGMTPHTWCQKFDGENTPALLELRRANCPTRLGDLKRDLQDREQKSPAIALLHKRALEQSLLPDDDLMLLPGDQLLWCSQPGFRDHVARLMHNPLQLRYLVSGEELPSTWLGRLINYRRSA